MQLLTIVQTVIFIIVMGLVFAENSIAQNTKISADLQSIHPADLVDVIVEFDPAAYRNSAADRQEKFRGMGATLKESLPSVRSEILSISRRDLTAIADDPGVVSVRPDRRIRSTSFNGSLDYSWMTTGAQSAFVELGLDGKGIGIAVVDSGVDEHPDLSSSRNPVRFAESMLPNVRETNDAYGHGTHIAGIIAGSGMSSESSGDVVHVRGIAPGAHIVSFRVLDENGEGSDSAVIRAIDRQFLIH